MLGRCAYVCVCVCMYVHFCECVNMFLIVCACLKGREGLRRLGIAAVSCTAILIYLLIRSPSVHFSCAILDWLMNIDMLFILYNCDPIP